ncbi:hypothetical protein KL921_003185 [Ogataea angusta]|uniref:Uncharacterized protein n=1 Tax=Pichia angusta TaxID=870730 RepID=A0AAN6DG19_PICAN|nr:uncharacterized protein KL928_003422 [Ogataea angusta]KAG7809188.1 hypothetical protein KL921_003185 [Ogataea angusta]KAG7817523.1 hypothetical protein KL928_003422 [Ogataea angusta]KAG7818421.1 hypothetical protein KL909_005043 [Ogataea angusta]KAG7833874.1 hypothetical protein KL943_003982 [Ogataea angusta]KAG7839427.1 hypothetical protein KL942_003038 [Ogataea angusta]
MSALANSIPVAASSASVVTDSESAYFADARSHLSESTSQISSDDAPVKNNAAPVEDDDEERDKDGISPQATITDVADSQDPESTTQPEVDTTVTHSEERATFQTTAYENNDQLAHNVQPQPTEEPKRAFVSSTPPKKRGYQREESECHEYYFSIYCCDLDLSSGNIFTTCLSCCMSSILGLCTTAATKL